MHLSNFKFTLMHGYYICSLFDITKQYFSNILFVGVGAQWSGLSYFYNKDHIISDSSPSQLIWVTRLLAGGD